MNDVTRDRAWYETQYLPSLTVPNAADLVAAWPVRADRTRLARPILTNIATGEHPREKLDLFRFPEARGTVVFIHGGYWRAFSRSDTAWVADGFLDAGYSVALLDYPLCPEVTFETLTDSVRRSFARLYTDVLNEGERQAIVVVGHSAGGHLTAALVATDWTAFGLPWRPFQGAVPISGLFDLVPLTHTSVNDAIRLTEEDAARLSPVALHPYASVPMTLVVGGDESEEFHRQGEALATAWSALEPRIVEIPGANHYTVIDGLAEPGSPLQSIVVSMLERANR